MNAGLRDSNEALLRAAGRFKPGSFHQCQGDGCGARSRKILESRIYAGYVIVYGECNHTRVYIVSGVPYDEDASFRFVGRTLVVSYKRKKVEVRLPQYMTLPIPLRSEGIETLAS